MNWPKSAGVPVYKNENRRMKNKMFCRKECIDTTPIISPNTVYWVNNKQVKPSDRKENAPQLHGN